VIPDHQPPINVVIIGTRAGGTLAWKLAPTGEPILLLERSDYRPRDDDWDTEESLRSLRLAAGASPASAP
jgi:choline dehydrogenase-like flavoprotein